MKSTQILKLIVLLLLQILLIRIKNVTPQEICPREGLECDISQKVKFCQLPDEVPLDKDGDIIAFKMNNFMSLKKILTIGLNNNNKLYVNGLYDDDKKEFKLFTTDAYKNYTLTETQTDFSLKAYFMCDGNGIAFESIYTFNVKISQTNLFPPQFSQEEYEKQISLPLIKGFGCIFSKVVKATDHDIKYNKITFSSDNEYLEVGTEVETADNGHTYFAAISIKKAITEINETFVIEIEAKDNGNPPLSSKTKLKLIADKQKSLPMQPRFTNAIYEANLTKPEELQINAELDLTTYDEAIVFNVTDRDSELFTINRESNKINIRLKDNKVDDEYVKERSYLSFILNAHNPKLQIPGQTAIVVGIPKNAEDIKKIYFEKDLYRGEINADNELEIEFIKLIDEANTENIQYSFEIQGDDMKLFEYKLVIMNELKLILKDDANWDGKYYLHISILAKMNEIVKSSTNVIIDVPVNKKDFRFEKPLFEGQINQTNQLEKLQIKFVDNENLNEIFFQILGENSNYFTIEIFENFAELKLKESELPAEWSKKKFLSFQIEARKHSYDAIYCGILVNLPNKLQLPQFPEILYKGKIISKKEIEELEIPVHNLGSRFGLSGHNSFTIDQRDGIIKIMLAGELSDEDLQLNYIALTLTAIFDEIDGGKSSTTIILSTPPLKLPPETSTSKPTTTSTTDGSTAATTTTTENPEPENVPKFEKSTYRFSIKADFVGIFGSVKALLEEESSTIIEYSTANVDDELKTRLLLYDDGRLGVSSTTPPGTYVFEVRANVIGNRKYGNAFVILDISPIKVCGDEGAKVENALLIKRLEEERAHKGIIKAVIGNCHYKIMSISPNDKEYFKINGNDLDLIAVDREDPIFSDMLIAQIQVKLILFDSSTPIKESLTTESDTEINSSESITENIIPTFDTTTEIEKIEDITKLIIETTKNIKYTSKFSEATTTIPISTSTIISTDPIKLNATENFESTHQQQVVLNTTEKMELTSEQVTKSTSEQSNSSENISQTSTEVNIENTEFIDETTTDIFISSADNNQFSFESVTQMDSKPDNIKFRTQSYYKSFSNSLLGRPQFRQVGQFNDGKSYVLTENIKSSLVETVLTVIIEDINDNKPIFEYPPPDTKFVIGYPDVEVSNNILPQYLIKVNATDLDIGLNALIRYKLDNPDFGIDEETGIIYPYSGAMENSNEISLTVYAVDRNGEMEGSLNSSVKIIVKKIHSYQLILLEFQGNQMENVDELLNEVSKNKGFDLIPLKWATVPNLTATNKQSLLHQMIARIHRIFGPAYSQKTTLKVWTYAINENADFVKSDKIIEKLSESSDVIAASYEDTVKYADASRDVTAFIVGIVILSVICIGCLGFISWVVYFRKALYEKTSSTSRSEVSSFAASLETNSTEPEKDSSTQSSNNVKRDTMKIAGTTTQETSDYQTRMLELLNDRNHKENDDNYENNSGNENFECDEEGTIPNGDIGGERRKSVVKFNELVERIEIEDRRGSQNSGISSERL